MGKRSRDASFSPSEDEAASASIERSTESEDSRTGKLLAYDHPTMSDGQHVMQCFLPPHSGSIVFTTLEDFEIHYAKEHSNRCIECRKNFPSEHFLMLHIDENHNPVREALAAKGEKTYACFVVDCEKKCSTLQKRRLHLIDKHNFPKVYNFRVIREGIDNTRTLLQEGRKRRVSVANDQSSFQRSRIPSVSEPSDNGSSCLVTDTQRPGQIKMASTNSISEGLEPDIPNGLKVTSSSISASVDDLERSLAALQFVPRSVVSKQWRPQS